MTRPATLDEFLVWTLAREVRPGDVVIVGVATPIATAAALMARELLVPDLTVIVGTTVSPAIHDVALPMVSHEVLDRLGAGTLGQAEILDQIQNGLVTLQFVSPAQVDAEGRMNTSLIARPDGTWLRLPGGLATADIAVLIGRLVVYRAEHSLRFLTAEVDFATGAGHEAGTDWRSHRALPGSGVQAVVTDRAVLRWSGQGFAIESVHSGSAADAATECGFPLEIPEGIATTPGPPAEALDLLRRVIDPHGMCRLEVRETRGAALDALAILAASRAEREPPNQQHRLERDQTTRPDR